MKLGDTIQVALSSIGVTEDRVEKVLRRPCGCGKHQEMLNRLGAWAVRVIKGKRENAEEYLKQILDEEQV